MSFLLVVLLLAVGFYLGAAFCFYNYASPMILKEDLVQQHGVCTKEYYERYRREMSNKKDRIIDALMWPTYVLEKDMDLDPKNDRYTA